MAQRDKVLVDRDDEFISIWSRQKGHSLSEHRDAIFIVCGFVTHSTRSDYSVTLLEACRTHLFAKLSKSYRPRHGLTVRSSIDTPLPVIYDTIVDVYSTVCVSIGINQYSSRISCKLKGHCRALPCAETRGSSSHSVCLLRAVSITQGGQSLEDSDMARDQDSTRIKT